MIPSETFAARSIKAHEAEAVQRANARGLQPVVFVHGLWLLPSSWDRWATVFEEAGDVALTPGWPDDPDTVAEAKAHPEVMFQTPTANLNPWTEAKVDAENAERGSL